jgi:1-phosphatidylinositol phosphodiesterase
MSILYNILPQRGKSPRPGWDAIRRWRTLVFFLLLCGFLIPLWTIKYPLNISSLAHLSIPSLASNYNDYHSPYSFDTSENHAPRWMTSLPSSRNLTSLSIPGTHDTMTNALNGPLYQCQNTPLSTQLQSGIRYFDIRARLNSNSLLIYHQDSYTNYTYTKVLTTFFSFLESNPGEMILMRLKEELTPINSTIDFLTAFNYYRLNSSITAPGCAEHFWIPPTPAPGPISIPTLGELRGKILILQNFGAEPAQYGIKWESPLLAIEDFYDIPDLYSGLDSKWAAIETALEAAGNEEGTLYLSHLSASVGVLPIEAAAGTRNGSVVGLNDRTGEWLKKGNGGETGVVVIDFPGKELIQEILKRNKT